ncbi:NUDIX hydrolase [Candidatus Pacearchaeota archaeon]|nr:NUDIX hydrolase [Candidatus Pacearchaeota archaeon]
MTPRKISQKKFSWIYSQVPRLCVEVILKTKDGVLLTKRLIPPSKGRWHFPGSGVLFGETLKQAVKRTAKEEINLNVETFRNYRISPEKRDLWSPH